MQPGQGQVERLGDRGDPPPFPKRPARPPGQLIGAAQFVITAKSLAKTTSWTSQSALENGTGPLKETRENSQYNII